ncbi:sporulation membrane protein YtrI [Virgibacillus doumboii]|uniref:sporulation membrane protein YtrI n=1 Tax=Virgibacillus doumboii TaxID=2697503 RepID=UPI0013DFE489|nr:sporulation membrane protein YtrI [Virgibacillus doumboii]
MHIPPYHKKSTWQRFFIGAFLGAVIAYLIFIYMHGNMYEHLLEENKDLKSKVTELENQNEALSEDKKDLDEKSKEPFTIESIEVTITNNEELRLDRLIIHDLEELIKKEINDIIGKEVSIIAKSDELLKSTIENKEFPLDEFTYKFDVTTLTITETVKVSVEAEISSSM